MKRTQPPPGAVSLREASERTGIGIHALRSRAKHGKLDWIKAGKLMFLSEADVKELEPKWNRKKVTA